MLQSLLLLAFLATAASTTYAQAGTPPQTPAEKPAEKPAQTPAQTPAAKPEAPPQPAFTYDPDGRRDPFVSLIGGIVDTTKPAAARPSGVPGLLIGEITVKGVIRDRTGFIALVQGPDEKTHMLRTGDKLLDGSVKSITPERVVFSQDVNDPLSLVKQREVSKAVRQGEGRGGASGI